MFGAPVSHTARLCHVKKLSPECTVTRCFLHRESLVTEQVSVEPSSVLGDVVDQRPGPSSSSYHRQVAF